MSGRSSEGAPRRADARSRVGTQSASESLAPDTPRQPPSDTSSQVGRPTLAFIRVRLRLVPEPTASAESRAIAAAAGPLGSPLGPAAAAVAWASSPPCAAAPARVSAALSRAHSRRGPASSETRVPAHVPCGPAGWDASCARMGAHACTHARAHTHTPRLGPWPSPADSSAGTIKAGGRTELAVTCARASQAARPAVRPEPRCGAGTPQ